MIAGGLHEHKPPADGDASRASRGPHQPVSYLLLAASIVVQAVPTAVAGSMPASRT
jgi:hypothetical protein